MRHRTLFAGLLGAALAAGLLVLLVSVRSLPTSAQDKGASPLAGDWIYDDLDAAIAQAEATGKPLLVGFR